MPAAGKCRPRQSRGTEPKRNNSKKAAIPGDKKWVVHALLPGEAKIVILYSPLGQALELERQLWLDALREAEVMGWRPEGTGAPPRLLGTRGGEPWQGDYGRPCGQEVRREDALEFGLALGRAGTAEFGAVRDFSLKSGFLICEPSDGWHSPADLLTLARRVGVKEGKAGREECAPEHIPLGAAKA